MCHIYNHTGISSWIHLNSQIHYLDKVTEAERELMGTLGTQAILGILSLSESPAECNYMNALYYIIWNQSLLTLSRKMINHWYFNHITGDLFYSKRYREKKW